MELRWIHDKEWKYGQFRLQVKKTKSSKWEFVPTEGEIPTIFNGQEITTPKCLICKHKKKWHKDNCCSAPLPNDTKCSCNGFKETNSVNLVVKPKAVTVQKTLSYSELKRQRAEKLFGN